MTIAGVDSASTIIDATGLAERLFEVFAAVAIDNLTLTGGSESQGGGIRVTGLAELTLTNVDVTLNSSGDGGGIHNAGTLTLVDSTIADNTATSTGGGIHNAGTLTLVDSTIADNTASTNGGGVFNDAIVNASGSTISNNNAIDGAGIYNTSGSTTSLTLTNVTLSGNAATGEGGGLNNNKNADLMNVTLTANSAADGGGIFVGSGPVTTNLTNSIIAGNTAPVGPDISGNVDSGGFNIVGDTSSGGGGLIGSDLINTDPLLDPILKDNGGATKTHAITAASPAYNAGTTTGAPAIDQRGETRDASPDIGAYELNSLVVDTTADTLDAPDLTSISTLLANKGADGFISLREAMVATNNTANGVTPDLIHFNITDPLVGGAHTIVVTSALPNITDTVVIDGTTDADFATTPIIVLDGNGAGASVDGLKLAVGSDGSTIRGLVVQRFLGDGIEIDGSSNNQIEGNYIGTDAAGTLDRGNAREGIHIRNGSTNNTIGGTTAEERNIISGNNRNGVFISAGSNGNQLLGNFIGTNAAGTSALGNTLDGLWIESSTNTIGGALAGAGNVISGNLDEGISIDGGGSGNVVQGNFIGTDLSRTLSLGNVGEGILIFNGTGNVIGGTAAGEGNTIAHSGGTGVAIDAGNQNAVRGNSIFDNSGLGIDLLRNGVTANDAGDGDAGPNTLQNHPVLTAATVSGSDLTVTGSLNSTANTAFDFDFFASATADGSGYGEAERYLGSALGISSDGSGNLTLNELLTGVSVSLGEFVTATATDQDGNTSEFALNVTVALASNILVVDTTSDVSDGNTTSIASLWANKGADGKISLREAIQATNATTNGATPDEIHFQITDPLVGGAHTILVGAGGLPSITKAVIIDGTTDDDYGGSPMIELNGTSAGAGTEGLSITGNGTTVRGLVINRFLGHGIEITGNNNRVELSYVGTDVAGSADLGNNQLGIRINGTTGNYIGGAGVGNVISGNGFAGIAIVGGTSSNNFIQGNLIGTDATGTFAIGNDDYGIDIWSGGPDNNTVGGTTAPERNVISGNGWAGIHINGTATGNVVSGNYIGTDITGILNIGNGFGTATNNGGIDIDGGATNNVIGAGPGSIGNLIAFNSGPGIKVDGAGTINNEIRENEIHSNTGIGIDLIGGNSNRQTASLSSVTTDGGTSITVSGSYGDGTLGSDTITIEYFSNPGNVLEGKTFLGSDTVVTDASGNATINHVTSANVAAGEWITATVTDSSGNTSEFSVASQASLVNSPPTDISPNSFAIDESVDTTGGYSLGTLSTTDPDTGDTFSYLIQPVADGAFFSIGGVGSDELMLDDGVLDFETKSSYSVSVQVTDSGGISYAETLTVNINDVNDTPTTIGISDVIVTEDDPPTVIDLFGAFADAEDLDSDLTFTIVSNTNVSLFDSTPIDGVAGTLTLNYGTNRYGTADITVQAMDTGLATVQTTFNVLINADNDAPTDIAPNSFAIYELTDTTGGFSLGSLTATDPDTGDSFAYSILAGGDGALFSIGGAGSDELILDDGVLDFETRSSYTVNVRVTDSGLDTYDATLTVTVNDLNEAPSLALAPVVTNLNEDADASSPIVVATITITDDALGTETLSLSGADAALFEVVGGDLRLNAGASLDFETNPSLDVTVDVDDATIPGSPDDIASYTITVNDVNEVPADITLDNSDLAENFDAAVVGNLAVVDPDAGDTHTWSVDDARFEIVGTQLKLRAGQSIDFETESTINLTITVTDQSAASRNELFSLDVIDINEAPSLVLTPVVSSLQENADTSSAIIATTIGVNDDALGVNDLTLSGADASLFEIVGLDLRLQAGTTLDFETNPSLDVTVSLDDAAIPGSPDDWDTLSLRITDVNEGPTAITPVSFNVDENTDTASGYSLGTMSANDPNAPETFAYNIQGGVDQVKFSIGGVDSNELIITNGMLDFESQSSYIVIVRVTDSGGATHDETIAVRVNDVNEPPTVSLLNVITAIPENTVTSSSIKIADIVTADDALGTHSLVLGGSDAAKFVIVGGNELHLRAGVSLDYESQSLVNVTVAVDDTTIGSAPDDTVSLALAIADVNESPIATDDTYVSVATSGVATTAGVLVNDLDPDGDPVTVTVVAIPGHGVLTLNVDGSFSYVPAPGFFGTDSFTYQIDDGVSTPSTATVTLVVSMPPITPTAPPAEQSSPSSSSNESEDGNTIESPAVEAVSGDVHRPPAEASVPQRRFSSGSRSEDVGQPQNAIMVDSSQAALVASVETARPSTLRNHEASQNVLAKVWSRTIAASFPIDTVTHAFIDVLNDFRDEMKHDDALYQMVVGSTTVVSTTLSVGYVIWLIRGGVLLSSVLSSLPAWQMVDPLPVLGFVDDMDDEDSDDESLESLVAHGNLIDLQQSIHP